MLTPMKPNGINPKTASPCNGERNERMMMNNISAKMSGMTPAMLRWDLPTSRFWPSKLGVTLGYRAKIGGSTSSRMAAFASVALTCGPARSAET